MRNYKYFVRILTLTLFFVAGIPLYAIDFDEPRRVIIPQYTNAVYRDLTVLHRMYLDVEKESDRSFLLELGKRPSYFWDQSHMYYLYQEQELDLHNIIYGDSSTNLNVFTVGNISLKNGSFASEGLFLGGDSILQVNKNSNLLVNYKGDLPVNLTLSEHVIYYNIFARTFAYSPTGLLEDMSPDVSHMYLRDVKFSSVVFPTPRMMIYKTGSTYNAKGTAINFEAISAASIKGPKSYYGPWEVWGPSNSQKGLLKPASSSTSPCGDNTYSRCYKIVNGKGYPDTDSEIFQCVGTTDTSASSYDPPEYEGCSVSCYDYQVVNIEYGSGVDSIQNYNGNKSFFEFKVEEVFQVDNHVAHLVSQRPRTRIKSNTSGGDLGILPISTITAAGTPDTWGIAPYSNKQAVYVDGAIYAIPESPKFIDSMNDNPCFSTCEGILCSSNHMYVRDVVEREIKGGSADLESMWPAQEGPKQDLIIRTYTVGFCPTKRSNYGTYEDNFVTDTSTTKLVEAMLIKDGENWVYPKVCLRREVKCSRLSETQHYSRHYKPLSTDY